VFAGMPALLLAFAWRLVAAWSGQAAAIQVSAQHSYHYGRELRLTAVITAPSPVTRAAVFIRTGDAAQTDVLISSLSSAMPTVASATRDLRLEPLPPFATVSYWWQIDTSDGRSVTTSPQTFDYIDDRFTWRDVGTTALSVHWVEGDLTFGQSGLDLAIQALARTQTDLLLQAPASIRIFIYPSQDDLQAGLSLAGRTWAGGEADPELGAILTAATTGPEGFLSLERTLPHEITHLLLYERFRGRYANLPTWLNEGLATLEEPSPSPQYRLALDDARRRDEILPIESLCSAFPTAGSDALLAYAESVSLVRYIRDVYGQGAIAALLDAYQEGASCGGGIQRVLRRSPSQVQAEWEAQALSSAPPPVWPWLAVGGVALAALGAFAGWSFTRARARKSHPPQDPPSSEDLARLHAVVEGAVQGVGFRYFVLECARAIGVTGFARNRIDGSVEVVAEGSREGLERLLAQLREGPRQAEVTNVETRWERPTGEFNAFAVRRF
jgi:acylphosphatase